MSIITIEIDGGQGELEHDGEYYSATGSAECIDIDGWVEVEETDLLICRECGEGSTIIKRKSEVYRVVEDMVKTKAKEAVERGENHIFD
tara:strand:+ start:445 stop:711 length:267 start_codon:yes stop_codon:yes gene_type:complete